MLHATTRSRRLLRRDDAHPRHARSSRRLCLETLESRRLLTHVSGFHFPAAIVDGESGSPMVELRLEATDLAGTPITQTPAGSEFYLSAWVRDARAGVETAGVYAAYFDLAYDQQLVTLVPSSENPLGIEIEFGVEYENGTSAGTSIPGLLDEVGAFQSGFDPLGAEEVLLFRARFTTQAVTLVDDFVGGLREDPGTVVLDVLSNDDLPIGTAGFVGDLADIRPWHDVVLFDPASVPPDDAIQLLGTSLQIATGDTVIEGVGEASAGGSVVIAPNGRQLLYTPAPDFFGTETFSYMIAGEEAEVTVVVEPINDVPAGVDDIYGSRFDETLVVTPEQGLLANDRDAEGDALSLTLMQTPTSGTLELQSDGSFVYLPAPGFRGATPFRTLSLILRAWNLVKRPYASMSACRKCRCDWSWMIRRRNMTTAWTMLQASYVRSICELGFKICGMSIIWSVAWRRPISTCCTTRTCCSRFWIPVRRRDSKLSLVPRLITPEVVMRVNQVCWTKSARLHSPSNRLRKGAVVIQDADAVASPATVGR